MNTIAMLRHGAKLASCVALLALGAVAEVPSAPALTMHKAAGVVRSVGDEVLIKHEPIRSLGMGAMTMSFKAPKGGLPKSVVPGTHVTFEFVVTPQGEMQITSIVPAAASKQPGR